MPKVSIIIPTYNTGKFLNETMESIWQQSCQDFEIIVVDDCSTDNTQEIIQSFTDDRIRAIFLEQNSGTPSIPRNVGVANSTGEYIVLFDSDDIMMPEKLERSLKAIKGYDNIGLLFTNSMRVNEFGEIIDDNLLGGSEVFARLPKTRLDDNFFKIEAKQVHGALYSANWIGGPSSCVIPKRILEDIGNFDASLCYAEDRDLFFRISSKYDFGYLNFIGHKYRKRKDSQVGQIDTKWHLFAESLKRTVAKQLQNEHDTEAIKAGKKLIAECYNGIGYYYQSRIMLRESRVYYLKSIRYNFNLSSLKGILKTSIHPELYKIIKNAKDKLREGSLAEK